MRSLARQVLDRPAHVHSTHPTEQEAREESERVWAAGKLAIVLSVPQMALVNDPLTPRTVNPWCVIARQRG